MYPLQDTPCLRAQQAPQTKRSRLESHAFYHGEQIEHIVYYTYMRLHCVSMYGHSLLFKCDYCVRMCCYLARVAR